MLDMGGGLVHDEATAETVRREDVSFDSADGSSIVRGYIWWPEALVRSATNEGRDHYRPHGIVEIVHGMAEHIERYDGFARYLARRGYVVSGYDQVGHGRTTEDPLERGVLPARGGRDILLADIDRMRCLTYGRLAQQLGERADDVPFFLFGHSMGSFEVRDYLAVHAEGVYGAIICGTGYIDPGKSAAGNLVARMISRFRGEGYRSELLHGMADGAYSKAIEDARTAFDWLSFNEDNVAAYMDDPACGFMFSAGGYATLSDLTRAACDPKTAAHYPKNLALLYVSGAEDPVGDDGQGVTKSAQMAQDAGVRDVRVRLYEGMRHEILQEAHAQRVMSDVANWMEEHLAESAL